ncbi:DUF4397 domain-containing protein [Olivibacter sp. SDN3]|uniref:DUF4397 domain-containing protein n=1 Tax=Olivibacter sp. SDN3 TaxID=2764720 RepID=UPI001650DC22|nr:DUF4397 domain-containing protein [Olivibacter sp. SDN3]QNL49927.1 DUF4397 domain-containing protein [Olivibacter sp. SDN3]
MKIFLNGAFILAISALTISCSKENDIDVGGNTNIKIINASQGSNDQDFYLANNKITGDQAVAFGSATDYIMTTAGDNLTAEFKNIGTENIYASGEVNLERDLHYSIVLAGSGENTRIVSIDDNIEEPANDRAKIRFIHVSDVLPEAVDIYTSAGVVLASNVAYNSVSSFIEIDPSITALRIAPTGTSDYKDVSVTAFAPEKIYSIIIAGSGDVQTRQISHN